jgi:hypothetical protein
VLLKHAHISEGRTWIVVENRRVRGLYIFIRNNGILLHISTPRRDWNSCYALIFNYLLHILNMPCSHITLNVKRFIFLPTDALACVTFTVLVRSSLQINWDSALLDICRYTMFNNFRCLTLPMIFMLFESHPNASILFVMDTLDMCSRWEPPI